MKKIIPILILSSLIIPIGVFADSIVNPLGVTTFKEIIDGLINFIFYIGIVVTPLMIIIAGLYILTAGGDPKKVEQGRHTIIYAMIGLFIILFAKGIISILDYILSVKTT